MNCWRKYSSSAAAFVVITALASPASSWDFDDATCAPSEQYETGSLAVPQIMLMLDRSGSMNQEDKWEDAVDAIDELVEDMTEDHPNTLHFGLGLFTTDPYDVNDQKIRIEVEAMQDAHSTIMNILENTGPEGGTPIASAIRAMKNSHTIQNAPGTAAGILITDGEPDRGTKRDVLVAACEHRASAPLYVVGFGDGTDEDFNNATAAAGGTGTCNGGDPCAPGSDQYDASHWEGRCQGSIQADDDTALENALNQLADQLACTFELSALTGNPSQPEWDDPVQGCTNYDCLYIQLNGSIGKRIFHEDSSREPTGWKWASSDHTQIQLLDGYCQALRNGDLNDTENPDIEVTRACMCTPALIGNACSGADMVPPPGTCECPVGTWTCSQGRDICTPNTQCEQRIGEGEACDNGQLGVCMRSGETECNAQMRPVCNAPFIEPPEQPEVTCDNLDNDCNGVVDDVTWQHDLCNPEHMSDQGPLPGGTDGVLKRCDLGDAVCNNGVAQCNALEAMPEVCNGIDDDCDGSIDNLHNSWQNFPAMSLENEDPIYAPAACYEANVCTCANGPDTFSTASTLSGYLSDWANEVVDGQPSPTCICGSGLSP